MDILSGSAAVAVASGGSQAKANIKAASVHKRLLLRGVKFILCRRPRYPSKSQRRVQNVDAARIDFSQLYLQCEITGRASLQRVIELIRFDKV